MRPGQKVFKNPGPDFGVRVIEPGFPSAAVLTWWDNNGAIGCCVGAWQARAAASYAASLLDLSSNGNNLTETAGPVAWNAVNGWQFAAAALQALDTGIMHSGAAATWTMIAQYANTTTGAFRVVGGAFDWGVAAQFWLSPNWTDTINVCYNQGGNSIVAPMLATGNLAVAGKQGYRNGVADGPPIPAGWTNFTSITVWIGCRHRPGVQTDMWYDGDVWAFALYDCVLNAGEVAAVAALMAAL